MRHARHRGEVFCTRGAGGRRVGQGRHVITRGGSPRGRRAWCWLPVPPWLGCRRSPPSIRPQAAKRISGPSCVRLRLRASGHRCSAAAGAGCWRFPIRGADQGFAGSQSCRAARRTPSSRSCRPPCPWSRTPTPGWRPSRAPTEGRRRAPSIRRSAGMSSSGRTTRSQSVPDHWNVSEAPWRTGSAPGNLAQLMPNDGEHYWRQLIEFRGSWRHRTVHRIWIGVVRGPTGPSFTDNHRRAQASQGRPDHRLLQQFPQPPVPQGKWFRFKIRLVLDRGTAS